VHIVRVAGFGPVVDDVGVARAFYGDLVGLPLSDDDAYPRTGPVDGANDFALWQLSTAAKSCFGTDTWPADIPVPQGWMEFAVTDLAAATAEVESAGHLVFVRMHTTSWGQQVTRFMSPEGMLVELSQA
jgi:predicted enzyme related to lactoylglutathione lyase